MEDYFCSTKCPNCQQSLLEAGLTNWRFLQRAQCPFCGLSVRWARLPMFLLLLGVASAGIGTYCMAFEEPLLGPAKLANPVAIGAGAALFLMGILLLRFVTVANKRGNQDAVLYRPYAS